MCMMAGCIYDDDDDDVYINIAGICIYIKHVYM